MKNQAVVFLVTFFLLAALLPKSDCFSGPLPSGKRQLQEEVGLLSVCAFSVVTLSAKRLTR